MMKEWNGIMEFPEYFDSIYKSSLDTTCTDGFGAEVTQPITEVVHLIKDCAKVILIGNGGSLSACSHMATDFCLAGITAMDLSNPVNISCIGNDFGFDEIFAKQIEWRANPDDLIIALSCSGKSKNIIRAVERSRTMQCTVITFSGFAENNPLRKLGDINFYTPSEHYGFVQLTQEAILHCIYDVIATKGNMK